MIGVPSFSGGCTPRPSSPIFERVVPSRGRHNQTVTFPKRKRNRPRLGSSRSLSTIPIHGAVGETRRVEPRPWRPFGSLWCLSHPDHPSNHASVSGFSVHVRRSTGENVNHASLTRGRKLLANLALGTALATGCVSGSFAQTATTTPIHNVV